MTEPARTIFLGSGSFAVPIAEAVAEHPSVDLVAIVTAPTRRGSRGRPTDPPVAKWAAERGLPMLRPVRLRATESITAIAGLRPHLLVLADYGQIVPSALLELPTHGALNLHPSLLPRHRGASPIPAAILEGDQETGVSLMLMDSGLDTGPVIAQRRLALDGSEVAPDLESALARISAELLDASLVPWLTRALEARPQPAEGATITRPLRREDGRLDPTLPAARLERQVRAYQPWPGSFIETSEGRVLIWRARVGSQSRARVGTLIAMDRGAPGLATADGALEFSEVQAAGGRRMSGTDLLRGRPGLIGASVLTPAKASEASSA